MDFLEARHNESSSVTRRDESTLALPANDSVSDFSAEVFSSLPRADQRRWAEIYLRGLLTAPGKKSIRQIADAVSVGNAHQSLQQFINQSPWEWAPVRSLIARGVDVALGPVCWSIERIIIPKRGDRSVGVRRRFVPEAGRMVNSQLALGVFLSAGDLSIPVNWRIVLSDKWNRDERLRRAAYIPESVTGKPEFLEALSMIDEMLRGWKITPAPIVGDIRHFAEADQMVARLAGAGADFALQIDGSLPITPADATAPPARTLHGEPSRRELAPTVRSHLVEAERRSPSAAPLTLTRTDTRSAILSSLVRITTPQPHGGHTTRIVRLIGEWTDTCGFTRFWVTTMVRTSLSEVLDLTRNTFCNQADNDAITTDHGLRDFEGRSYRGLHHHLTMVSAAFAYTALHSRRMATTGS
ncbi:transposase [Micromonospora sp. WMMD714]|uniref:IS701 family transposase n=1 Tax=Micromonospora sp. WMMD714 TaxID=3016097 RepID=UPI00249C5A73|nr:transposase [Micromonospora sp. WMMD714]WFE62826.1 transposase [Micromonospora sp. WMMD714]